MQVLEDHKTTADQKQIKHLLIQGYPESLARFAFYQNDKEAMQASNMLLNSYGLCTHTARAF